MIRAFYHSGTGNVTIDLPATDWQTALHDQRGVLWVDFNAAAPVEAEPHLRDTFGFHVLAIDDALREAHIPPRSMTGATTSTQWSTASYLT